MGLTKGLDAMREKVAKAAEGGKDLPKTVWFKLEDGQTKVVRFAQEMDDQSPLYNADAGVGFFASEISDPNDFKKKCLSTLEDEGRCFGLEMHQRLQGTAGYDGGWRPKSRFYINVIVTLPDGSKEVQVLSQGLGPKQITPALLEMADEYHSITDREFKITRTGKEFNNTSYTLTPRDRDVTPFDFSPFELYELEKVAVRNVPYAEQAAFFGYAEGATDEAASSTDVDW